ncbi:ribosomal protein L7/L12 C-terminal domain-containing protein [Ochromonadaceae sp. CCMP2298]|nr:ribosomal protein L7/L12 C-terminal domain-containing protein [Ochromonadaceae sp. CCMP2298]
MGGEGSSLPAGGGGSAGGAAEPVVVVVKDAFDIKLTEFDPKSKIKVIKEVRAITGLGLKEAKEMVEGAPIVVKQGLKKDEAEKLIAVLLAAGGKCELV